MAAQDKTKFFWVKLFTRFFDKHEIQILWGKNRDFVLLYIRLLLESVPNGGILKYNSELSYTTEDISILFHMPEDVVSAGLKELSKRQLITIEKDGTINVPAAPQMCGFDTGMALRMKDMRNESKCSGFKSGSNEPKTNPPKGSNAPRIQNSEFKDKNTPPLIPPKGVDEHEPPSVSSKGSDEFDHVSRDTVSNYFKRMRTNGGRNSSNEIEEDFWQYLVSVDFKKGDGMPVTSSNMHTTFSRWITNRTKESRKECEEAENARKAEEDELLRRRKAEARMAYSLAHETDD